MNPFKVSGKSEPPYWNFIRAQFAEPRREGPYRRDVSGTASFRQLFHHQEARIPLAPESREFFQRSKADCFVKLACLLIIFVWASKTECFDLQEFNLLTLKPLFHSGK
jgi:hypothetical protein